MVKFNIKLPVGYDRSDVLSAITETLPAKREEIKEFNILRRSLNLSDKGIIHYDLTVEVAFSEERAE